MNPLQLLPAKVRLFCYATYGILALASTSATAYFVTVAQASGQDVVLPNWLIGGSAALVPIGAAFAAVAVSNTTKAPDTNTAVLTTPTTATVTATAPLVTDDPDAPPAPLADTPLVDAGSDEGGIRQPGV